MTEQNRITEADPRVYCCNTKYQFALDMKESSASPFQTLADVMQFCACYAVHKQGLEGKLPIETRKGDLDVKSFDRNIIDYIGAFDQQSLESFKRGHEGLKDRIRIFEEYANFGLALIQKEQSARSDTALTEFFLSIALEATDVDDTDDATTDMTKIFS